MRVLVFHSGWFGEGVEWKLLVSGEQAQGRELCFCRLHPQVPGFCLLLRVQPPLGCKHGQGG